MLGRRLTAANENSGHPLHLKQISDLDYMVRESNYTLVFIPVNTRNFPHLLLLLNELTRDLVNKIPH